MDGWKQDDNLPPSWFMKPRKDKINEATASYHYLTDNFSSLTPPSKSAVNTFLSRPDQYTQENVAKLDRWSVNAQAKILVRISTSG